mmetsp:Transcript_20153/g.32280  ORF Transcript_20153/g.32280 Transcript_20153/m.32280 type:complete len:269 (-) Transcript_20153:63-869(-)
MAALFQVRLLSPLPRNLSMSSILACSKGRSTSSSVSRILLYVFTIISRFPVCCLNVSFFSKILVADSGTSMFNIKKYLTSRSRQMRAGSKLTRKKACEPPSSRRRRFILSFSCPVLLCSMHQLSMCTTSNSFKLAMIAACARTTSLPSSLSNTDFPTPLRRVMGSSTRSMRPLDQNTAPACGGALSEMGGSSWPPMNISCTERRSSAYELSKSVFFFSKSDKMISRSRSPSNASKSLKQPSTVVLSSKACTIIEARRRSSSLMQQRKV